MRRLIGFNNVTLDGYFTGTNRDPGCADNGKQHAEWTVFIPGNLRSRNNTDPVKNGMVSEIFTMENGNRQDMLILGSGSIVSRSAQEGSMVEYQIVVNPVVLGKLRTAFDGVKDMFAMTLAKTKTFGNGNALLWYKPVA